ncbi:MAG TPA: FtsX-like permease family protein, partial [bacterium]|nr:FtsX-like permease family protein [bacterium]
GGRIVDDSSKEHPMNVWTLAIREILHRKGLFALGVIAVAVAVGVLVGSVELLRAHDLQTASILTQRQDEMEETFIVMQDDYRKIMKKLGFNLLILPQEQSLEEFYANGALSHFMPQEYSDRLARSGLATIQHLLPLLEQQIQLPEFGDRAVLLVGVKGEVPQLGQPSKEPIMVSVPDGAAVVGYAIWKNLGLKPGDGIKVLESEFRVAECLEERGSKDDISIWINLNKAQQLLDKPDLINAIQALKCHCQGSDLPNIRKQIAGVLPGTQVIEFASEVITRAEARDTAKAVAEAMIEQERINRAQLRETRESFVSWLIPVVIIGSGFLVAVLAFGNVRERRAEIGILRAIGVASKQVLQLFLWRGVLIGLLGAPLGFLAGCISAAFLGAEAPGSIQFICDPRLLLMVWAAAPILAAFASWPPAMAASQQDPALILREQ